MSFQFPADLLFDTRKDARLSVARARPVLEPASPALVLAAVRHAADL